MPSFRFKKLPKYIFKASSLQNVFKASKLLIFRKYLSKLLEPSIMRKNTHYNIKIIEVIKSFV